MYFYHIRLRSIPIIIVGSYFADITTKIYVISEKRKKKDLPATSDKHLGTSTAQMDRLNSQHTHMQQDVLQHSANKRRTRRERALGGHLLAYATDADL